MILSICLRSTVTSIVWANKKCIYGVKQILTIAAGMYKRKQEYEGTKDKNDQDLIFILFDELLAKHKNEKITLRNLEQFLIGIRKFKRFDYRIDLLKKFFIWDGDWLSNEVVEAFYLVIKSWGHSIESILLNDLKKMFIDIGYLEKFIKQKLLPNAPPKLVSKLLKNVDRHWKIFFKWKNELHSKLIITIL